MAAEQQRVAEALRELMQPIAHIENPGCCPFTLLGLRRMWSRDPALYSVVADYHGWPTNFTNVNKLDGQAYCRGAVRFRSQRDLSRHVEALARRAPPFYTPPTIPPNPVEEDSEEDLGQDDDYNVTVARNLQAHVFLRDDAFSDDSLTGDEMPEPQHLTWRKICHPLPGDLPTVPERNAFRWDEDNHYYVPEFTLKPGENELDLYFRWREFEAYFRHSPDLWVALQVDPRGNLGCHYVYVGPYITAEHRRALNNLIFERGGFNMFQMLAALLPPTATLVCYADMLTWPHTVAARRLTSGRLIYNKYLLFSRGGYPVPDPDPTVTYTVNLSQAMQLSMAPFDSETEM